MIEDGEKYEQSIFPAEHEPAATSDQAGPLLHVGFDMNPSPWHYSVLIPVLLIGNEPSAIQTV